MQERENIVFTLQHLGGLDNRPSVRDFLRENGYEQNYRAVCRGIDELVCAFNELDDEVLCTMGEFSHIGYLKSILDGIQLPTTADIDVNTYRQALSDARCAFLNGQRVKKQQPVTSSDIVRTPSMDIAPRTLIAGTGMHLYERYCFAWMRSQGMSKKDRFGDPIPFETDDVIYALEECMLVLYARAQLEGRTDNVSYYFEYMTKPNSENGLGWRSAEDVDQAVRSYGLYCFWQIYNRSVDEERRFDTPSELLEELRITASRNRTTLSSAVLIIAEQFDFYDPKLDSLLYAIGRFE